MESKRGHTISFKNAFRGLFWAFSTQPNFRIHTLAAAVVILAGWFFHLTKVEFLVLFLTIFLVIVTEMLNTALEAATDRLAEGEFAEYIRIAKDVSAGAVLLAAMGAVVVGLLIFCPRIYL